jgi:hypothetical protein
MHVKKAGSSSSITTQMLGAMSYAAVYRVLQKTTYQTRSQSIIKPGYAQLSRLGHCIKRLESCTAHYINLTDASLLQESHSPFAEPAGKNEKQKTFFREASTGQSAGERLWFRAEGNWYEVPR